MSPPGAIPTSVSEATDSLNARGTSSDVSKPCRACTDFKTWAKLQAQSRKPKTTSAVSNVSNADVQKDSSREYSTGTTSARRQDCPVDKDELGTATWTFLHTMAAYYPDKPSREEKDQMTQFIKIFSNFYPCDSCASHFRKMMTTTPPEVDSQHSLSQWFCKMHNFVNARLHKPLFDCSKINERWRDGWPDGSCD